MSVQIFHLNKAGNICWSSKLTHMQNPNELVIETNHLSFGFNKAKAVVHGINLQIPKGAIYGFLGPNGAGKTTTIRLLLNLLNPSEGAVKIFGQSVNRDRNLILSRIGALIETPSLYEHLTGFDNLRVTASLRNIAKSRVMEVLEIVRLGQEAGKRVHSYSLGMKQRLGLALALLSSPDLLILDEPANGLDPNGIIEIRELLLDLNVNHGVTVLVSSHLLPEVEKLVSHIGIIDRGEMLFQGSVKELHQVSLGKALIEIDTNENSRALKILLENSQPARQGREFLEVQYVGKQQLGIVITMLVTAGLHVSRAQLIESTLEETFLSFIKTRQL